MTHLVTQSKLERLSDAELHGKLSQIYNDLAQGCLLATAAAEEIKAVLRRRQIQGPKP
jgi:hypothetical protein